MDENTPYYPGWHLLGSRDWTSDERGGTLLGEWDGPQIFDKGEPPLVRPEVRIVGSPECIEDGGGGAALTHATNGLDNWLPSHCYVFDGAHPRARIVACPDVAKIAEIMAYVFIDHVRAQTLAEEFVGDGAVAAWHAGTGDETVSTSVTCVRGMEAWQFIDGTRNQGQLLSQILQPAAGPTMYPHYGATALYHRYATSILTRFSAAGATGARRYVLVGHSYGGAAAAVAAARLKLDDPTRDVALYTLGAPLAGDSRLIDVLRTLDQTHIRRPLDPVPYLPPANPIYGGLLIELAFIPFLEGFRHYASYERRRLLDVDGFRDELPTDGPNDTTLLGILARLAGGEPILPGSEHDLINYANDLASNCGLPLPFLVG